MYIVCESNKVEIPIHLLLHCLTPAEQGCGKLFSLDKSYGKVTGVPNHRVKNISSPLSQLLAQACSIFFFLIVRQIKSDSDKKNLSS